MTDEPDRPKGTGQEGFLYEAALRQAADFDKATDKAERRKALARLLPSFLVALVMGYLRDLAMFAAGLASVVTVFAAFSAASSAWTAALITSGVLGCIVSFVPKVRSWRAGAEWLTYLTVVGIQVVLIVLMGRTS